MAPEILDPTGYY
uniref:Tal-like protein 4A n=1 Tax=Anopheles gambiae TaxID=7165 RepID=A3RLR9_ANOGA|nr:tal-like protein 4A [Anopheles gambiae]